MKLTKGLYEDLIDTTVAKGMDEASREGLRAELRRLDSGDSHSYLAQYLAAKIRKALVVLSGPDKLERQLGLSNRITAILDEALPAGTQRTELLQPDLLFAIVNQSEQSTRSDRPDTPLSANCLITGTRLDPSLLSQLRKELGTADRLDILCSFIKWGGVRILEESLRKLTESGARLRLITTSYMGATDLKAVELIRGLPNTEIRVSYDTRRTRLHAKAYIVYRNSGLGTAYVGSSNLSQAALTDGLEWNVKISQRESPQLWEKLSGTFETYWNDAEFVPYVAESRERLRLALERERSSDEATSDAAFFDIKPYTFQEEILDRLTAERLIHGRWRNLVVAATGTGKTVVAAFDYARFRGESLRQQRHARLLFVAHREEILKQSLACFRGILRDHNFGDLLVGGRQPASLDHLFISIQSFNSRELWKEVDPEFYDFVVVDEFHHAASRSYQRLLEWVQPKVLLGLTATPERMDELDILSYFGGHIAAEIRLPDAINRKLLAPFQYFGITDSVDFSRLRWQRGGYLTEDLDRLVTGNEVRARLTMDKVRQILLDVKQARGLGFCVSIAHAEYMARVFNQAGIRAAALSANSPDTLRGDIQRQLVDREINFIFVVDLYNEGVDIPEVDTVLLLRPTESLTVFLQQLGRGLRLHPDKDCLTVLDFIGQAHANFSFEARFRALMGRPGKRLEEEVEEGFPHLPAGCVINLERIAKDWVLENILQAVGRNRNRLCARIASFEAETGRPTKLADFLKYHQLDLDEIYRRGTWSRLLVTAGLKPDFQDPDERKLAKGLRRLARINGAAQLESLLELLPADPTEQFVEPADALRQHWLLMLHFALWGRGWLPSTIAESVERLRKNSTTYAEVIELLRVRREGIVEAPPLLDLPFLCPLELHADYSRDEILAALGVLTLNRQRELREGVVFIEHLQADVLFVTLDKTESDYSPSTMYEDYAISEELFHWQSQSTTSSESRTGHRYIHHAGEGSHVLLLVREKKEINGLACPYTFLGPAKYVSHEGSRPMSIVWRLQHRLPARLLRRVRRLA